MGQKLFVVECAAQDGQDIQSLWVHNLGGYDADSAARKLRLGYLHNPAAPGLILGLKVEGEALIQGTLGLHPRRYHLGSAGLNAVALADYAVNVEHRALGPALMLMRRATARCDQDFDFCFGIPNPRAAPLFRVAGLLLLGQLQRYAAPLRSLSLLARHMPMWAARLAAPIADLALHLQSHVRWLVQGSRLRCTPADWEDPAIAAIWAARPAGLMLSERSALMLRWRFGQPGRDPWHLCLARDAAAKAVGYVVWRERQDFVEVGDFFTTQAAASTAALMLAFVRFASARAASSVSLEFMGAAALASQLLKAGLRLRPEAMPVFVSAKAIKLANSVDQWYCTAFDADAD